ncbi:MAG: DegT/DnrJ/EryC1/StrS family aminotransferase [Anaerolineae bacterium]|nr:DegT/DnrJ/EryC1/StrS family aminotransferase [Anaerolineae bacterium]
MIPVFKPAVGDDEWQAVRECFQTGWIGLGPKTAEFEQAFGKTIGAEYVVGMNSCSSALDMAFKVLGISGGEVITPSLTFVSTNHAILYNNCTPVFGDVTRDTLTLDPDDVRRKITPNTVALMLVHYAGHPCDLDAFLEIAREHNLAIIEDCAHAAGSTYNGQPVGTFGDAGCFSFHAVKNVAMGEGGALVVKQTDQYERAMQLRWCGISKSTWERARGKSYSWQYDVQELGYKYHLSDIAAAIGLVQLGKIEQHRQARKHIWQTYDVAFADLPVQPLAIHNNVTSTHLIYVLQTERRDEMIDFLRERGIGTSVHYYPNHLFDLYRRYPADIPITEEVWQKIITLPIYPALTSEQVETVIEGVRAFYQDT